eukprot:8461335-Pyramimonas_sp.AAC.1
MDSAVVEYMLQCGVTSDSRVRRPSARESKALLYVVAHVEAAPLANVRDCILGASAPFIPRRVLRDGHASCRSRR